MSWSTYKPYSESELENMLNEFSLPELKSITEYLSVKRVNKKTLVAEIISWSGRMFELMQSEALDTQLLSKQFKKGAYISSLSHEGFELRT
ncbi:hypothetical protein QTV43_000502 [Vibrio vulnificus]|nr:hypothetical protein [Vibrio vulnificus]